MANRGALRGGFACSSKAFWRLLPDGRRRARFREFQLLVQPIVRLHRRFPPADRLGAEQGSCAGASTGFARVRRARRERRSPPSRRQVRRRSEAGRLHDWTATPAGRRREVRQGRFEADLPRLDRASTAAWNGPDEAGMYTPYGGEGIFHLPACDEGALGKARYRSLRRSNNGFSRRLPSRGRSRAQQQETVVDIPISLRQRQVREQTVDARTLLVQFLREQLQ